MKEEEKSDNKPEEKINNDLSEILPEEVFEGIPVEDRGRIKSIVSQTMISGVMKRSNPISEKITTDHITKLIDNSNAHDIRDREERSSDKKYQIAYFIIGLIFLGFLIVFLKDDKELLYKIVIAIISFVGGFGIGKNTKTKKEED